MPLNNRRDWGPKIAIILGAGVLFLLVGDVWEWLRGGLGWRWDYQPPTGPNEWVPALVAVSIYFVGALLLDRHPRRRAVLLWSYFGSAILPWLFLYRWGQDPLYLQFTRTISRRSIGFQQIAADWQVVGLLKDWTVAQSAFEEFGAIHVATAPPGLPLMYEAAVSVMSWLPRAADAVAAVFRPMQCQNLELMSFSDSEISAALLGVLSPFWAAMAVFPLHWLARQIVGDRVASRTVLLWALVPGIVAFTPSPSTVYPVLSLLVVAAFWHALVSQRGIYATLSGLGMFVASFVNFATLPIVFLVFMLGMLYHISLRPHFRWTGFLREGALFVVGFLLPWGILAVLGLPDPVAMLRTGMLLHVGMAVSQKPYLPWIGLGLYDYALFLGLPLALLVVLRLRRGIRSPVELMACATSVTLLVLALSGITRGENGRIWLFMTPFSLLVAVSALSERTRAHFDAVVLVQSACVLFGGLFLVTMSSGLVDPPASPPTLSDPHIVFESDYVFDGSLRLTGYGGTVRMKQLTLDLSWQVVEDVDQPYYYAVIPVAPDGKVYSTGRVYQPFDFSPEDYPATCWRPGQTVMDRIVIPLEGSPPEGDWWVSLSLHDFATYEKVSVRNAVGELDHQAGLGPLPSQ